MTKSEFSTWGVRASAIALLLAVFCAGAVAGVAGYRWLVTDLHGTDLPHPRHEFAGRFRNLNLSEEQKAQVHAVFERYRPKLDAVLREAFPKVRVVQEQIDADILKLLTEEQRRKFTEGAKHHGPPHLGPPGEPDGFGPRGPQPFDDRGPMPPPDDFGGNGPPPDLLGGPGPGFAAPSAGASPSVVAPEPSAASSVK